MNKRLIAPLAMGLILSFAAPSLAAGELRGETIRKRMAERFNDYVKDLETLTNIDSGTGDVEGSAAIAQILKARLEKAGGAVELRTNDKGTHVIGRFKGEGKLKLLMLAHTDTVFVKGDARKRPFRMDDKRLAYGPGVGDDKATVVQTLYAMDLIQEAGFKNFAEIVLYYNAEEETGSEFSEEIIQELARGAHAVLVMDTARPNWGIVTKRKGLAQYELKVEGVSGHAGNAPHRSASAVMELGNQLSELYRLASPLPANPMEYSIERMREKNVPDRGQFIPDNTINVGVIETPNQKRNVIPNLAAAKLEVRCFDSGELRHLDHAIKALSTRTVVPGTKVAVTGGVIADPVEKSPAVQKLVDLYKKVVLREFGVQVVEWQAGGITDGNVSAPYAPTLDALGVENYDEHTEREWVDLNTVEPRTAALLLFIQELASDQQGRSGS